MYEKRKHWMVLCWAMAGGVKSEYDRIWATEIVEFWYLFDMWLSRIKKMNSAKEDTGKKGKNGR